MIVARDPKGSVRSIILRIEVYDEWQGIPKEAFVA